MKTSKIRHRERDRIMLQFPFDTIKVNLVKQIEGATWSQTHKAWHIPYNKEAYDQLIKLFPEAEICSIMLRDFASPHTAEKPKEATYQTEKQPFIDRNEIIIEVRDKIITLKMPKSETDIQFIRNFNYVRWDNAHFRWLIPNYGNTLERIKSYFSTRITRIETKLMVPPASIPGFDAPRTINDLPAINSECLQEIERFKQWMEQKRYSESTVKTYEMAITAFLRFIQPKTSAEATNEDMRRFVYEYMIPRKLSFSYQNQAVNPVGLKK